jgi:hypothetical protein
VRFEDFILQLDASARGGFRARVLKSPFGEGVVAFALPEPAGEDSFAGPPGATRDMELGGQAAALTLSGGEKPPVEVGSKLFNAVFQGQIRTLLDKSLGQLQMSPGLGLRLKIKLDPGDPEIGVLADLPWELLCDGETEEFFALSRHTSLVRYLDVPRPSQPIPFTPPLRILAVGASPRDLQPLDLREEMRRLTAVETASSGIEIQFLEHASAGAVRERLAEGAFNILHFMGHGTFDRASGEGMLAFEAPGGDLELVSGRAFATKLRDSRTLGVVVLNACNTARAGQQGSSAKAFRGVATALVLGGIPAVVAMRRPIADRAALGFSTAFYRHLARGDSIDEALAEGRQAIHSSRPDTDEWATPVLFLRMPEGNVFVPQAAAAVPSQAAAPLPPEAANVPPVAPPGRDTMPSARRWAPRFAVGAAGAALAFGVYTKVIGASHDGAPPGIPSPAPPALSTALAPGTASAQGTKPSRTDSQTKKDLASHASQAASRTDKKAVSSTDPRALTPSGSTEQRNPPGASPGGPNQPPGTQYSMISAPSTDAAKPAPAPLPADVSKLSAQVIAIERRDGGGLRVTVTFANGADRPLAAVLDLDNSVLSDEQGQRYSILDSDLSASNGGVDFAAGASARHTFDFQAPKLGSRKFFLALVAKGGRLRVAGSPITLEGSP